MQDKDKTKEQLIAELKSLRQRFAESEKRDKKTSTGPTELRRRAEERLKAKQTETDRREVNDTGRSHHELQVHQIELEMRNQELRNAFVQAGESRTNCSDLYDFAPLGYLTIDENGLVLEANLTIARQLGVERSRLVGSLFSVYVVLADRNAFYSHLSNVLKDKTHQACEVRLIQGGEGDFHALLDTIFVEDANGNGRLRTSVTDITERRTAEEALKEGDWQSRAIFDQAFQFMGLLTIDGRLIAANRTALQFVGVEESDVIGKPFWETPWWIHSTELQEKLSQAVKKAATGDLVQFEAKFPAADGSLHCFHFSLKPVRNEAGGIVFLVPEARDISERKRAEEALLESENKFKSLAEQALTGIYIIQDGVFKYVNPKFAQMFGYTVEECLNDMPFKDLVYEEDLDLVKEQVRRRTSVKAESVNYSFRGLKKNGQSFYVEVYASTSVHDGKPAATGTILDITERKQAEDELRASEQRLADIVDFLPDATFVINSEGIVIAWNRAIEVMTGVAKESMIGKGNMEYSVLLYGKRRPQLIDLQFADEEEIRRYYQSVSKIGDTIIAEAFVPGAYGGKGAYLWSISTPLYDKSGKVIAAIESIRDITERQLAKETLEKAETKYRAIFENAMEGIFQTTLEGGYIAANPAYANMLGYNSPDELMNSIEDIGRQIYADQAQRKEITRLLMQNGHVKDFRAQLLHKDGTTLWVTIDVTSILDPDGNVLYYQGSMLDITERKLMEETVAKAEQNYRDIFDNSVTGIYQVTLEGHFLKVNAAFARLHGYDSPQEMLNEVKNARHLHVHPASHSEMLRLIEEHGSILEFEVEFFRKDKRVVWASLNVRTVRDSKGGIAYLEGTASDITDRKLLKARLDQAQKLEAIGALAGGIAHDFNNILQPIILYTEMELLEIPTSSPMRDSLERVLKASLRAKELVGQILAVSRSDQEQQRMPTDISPIIKEALKLLRSSIPTSIEIRQKIRKGIALADPTQIHQVLMNLCTNAAHAMGEKGVLEVGLSHVNLSESDLADQSIVDLKHGSYLKLCVSDTGSGMDAKTMARIFDPYFTTKEVGKGSGLGLAVVYGIVKRHEGAITVRSESGKGTTFSVYIPRIQTVAEVPIEMPHKAPIGTESILLLDDEQPIVKVGTVLLERLGYKVRTETDSLRALEVFSAAPDEFDLIITDYTMPNLTGIDFANEVRRIRPDMPVMLCTGFSDKINPHSLKELGVELLMKPYALRQISEAVRKVLDARKGY